MKLDEEIGSYTETRARESEQWKNERNGWLLLVN